MAIQHVVDGPVLVKFGTASSEVSLGYTRDGVRVRIQELAADVKSDDYGGENGIADRQMFGLIAHIFCELTKYDRAEVEKLSSFIKGGTAGVHPALGTLKRQDTKTGQLILDGVAADRTFAVAFPTQAYEVNSGTRFSTAIVTFEAWINTNSGLTLFTNS